MGIERKERLGLNNHYAHVLKTKLLVPLLRIPPRKPRQAQKPGLQKHGKNAAFLSRKQLTRVRHVPVLGFIVLSRFLNCSKASTALQLSFSSLQGTKGHSWQFLGVPGTGVLKRSPFCNHLRHIVFVFTRIKLETTIYKAMFRCIMHPDPCGRVGPRLAGRIPAKSQSLVPCSLNAPSSL